MADQCKLEVLYTVIIICILLFGLCCWLVFCVFKLKRRRNDYLSLPGNEDEVQKYKEFYEEEKIRRENALHQLELYKDKYNEEKKEKEDALQRLSRIMSDRLTDGNPNIANLNDCKRPTKLAEEFSELYDNEWTAAFEKINNGNEEQKIGFLLRILQSSFRWCKEHADSQLQKMKDILVCPGVLQANPAVDVSVNQDLMKRFKDERKLLAEKTLPYVIKQVLADCRDKCESSEWKSAVSKAQLEAYCRKCAALCWYLAIQDPPMDMKFSDIRQDDVKAYTRSGVEIEYVVWPPLLLQENGNYMSKGIAQFRSNN